MGQKIFKKTFKKMLDILQGVRQQKKHPAERKPDGVCVYSLVSALFCQFINCTFNQIVNFRRYACNIFNVALFNKVR